jgi:ATP synthase protein I
VIQGSSEAYSTKAVSLSDEEKHRLASRGREGLFRILLWQVVVSLVVASVFFLLSGSKSALSALAGAGCYLAPNAVFVMRLVLSTFKPQGAGAGVFLIGNGLKLLAAGGLLWLLAEVGGSQVDWLAALVGLIAALKGHWFGMLVAGRRLGKML